MRLHWGERCHWHVWQRYKLLVAVEVKSKGKGAKAPLFKIINFWHSKNERSAIK
jgi:hypothetical protein